MQRLAIATASLLMLVGCQQRKQESPIGLGCLPGARDVQRCRDLPIVSHPPYPPKTNPALTVVAEDPSFVNLVGLQPKLIPLAKGFGFTEGPSYVQMKRQSHGYLMFSDGSHNSVYAMKWNGLGADGQIQNTSWDKPVLVRFLSGNTDGTSMDRAGRLVMADQGARRLSIMATFTERLRQPDLPAQTLVSRYRGIPLNSPNDVTVRSDGTIWFSDPTYGHYLYPPLPPYLPPSVYRYDPKTQRISLISDKFDMPNGLHFSPDERTLYVVDSGASQGPRSFYSWRPHAVLAIPVSAAGDVEGPARKIADISPGFPDGIRVDQRGNLYVTNQHGVVVLSKTGKTLGRFVLPYRTGNLSFGGKENNILFICSGDSVWAIKLNVKGARPVSYAND